MNFEIGKKYHNPVNPSTQFYRICIAKHTINDINYCTWEVRKKNDNSFHELLVCRDNYLKFFMPYVKLREVTHTNWVYWIKNRKTNEVFCYLSRTETFKESYEKIHDFEFLKCEKITYTETVEE